jgi:hypothetical protein
MCLARCAPATIEANLEADLVADRASFLHRNGWLKWVAGGLLLAAAVAAGIVSFLLRRAEPFMKARIVAGLEDHFHARVELDTFHLSLRNGIWAQGKGLRIWPPAEVRGITVPGGAGPGEPLIQLDQFRFHAPLHYERGKPIDIPLVELKGLHISLPPKSHFEHPPSAAGGDAGSQGASKHKAGAGWLSFKVDKLECTGAQLVLGTNKPGKLPLDFEIAHLKLTNLDPHSAMRFEAELTNPRPVGTIHSTGSFGPWRIEDPGESPVSGDYRFEHADLGNFKGIAGILSSTGHYEGTLRDLVVDGETDTPDFRLSDFGNALALHTRFHAKVDGTNGDTWLEPVDATLGHSHFLAQGQVVRVVVAEAGQPPHSVGHDIALNINVDRARIEDFLRLASRSATPLLTGNVTVKAKLHIPPGTKPVHERMKLDGGFSLNEVGFESAKIQDRIEQLSLRGQGRPEDVKSTDPASIHSQMQGNFDMAGGLITLPELKYTVPGVEIQLKGTYALKGGALDFVGTAKTEATVSKMLGGWKGFLLKPADRFFKKDGAGTEIPIHIDGTREAPKFGIDFDRMKSSSAERPGDKPGDKP